MANIACFHILKSFHYYYGSFNEVKFLFMCSIVFKVISCVFLNICTIMKSFLFAASDKTRRNDRSPPFEMLYRMFVTHSVRMMILEPNEICINDNNCQCSRITIDMIQLC